MKMKVKFFFIITFFLALSICADDFGIAMPDQVKDTGNLNNSDGKNNYILVDRDEIKTNGAVKSHTIQDSVDEYTKKLTWRNKILSSGVSEPYKFENNENQIVSKNNEIYRKIYNKGTSVFEDRIGWYVEILKTLLAGVYHGQKEKSDRKPCDHCS